MPIVSQPASLDAHYLDAQYNNRLRVPDFLERHVKLWESRSAHTRASHPCTLSLPYGGGGPTQTLDVFPADGSNRPVMVFIHGGYWRSLDKADFSFVASAFTREGVCVVVPNYSLCPQVSMKQLVLEQVQALAWVYRNIRQHGGDPARITVLGHSAGGHLAAMLIACQWQRVAPDLPANLVRNAMSVSGLHDLAPIQKSPYLQTDLCLTNDEVQQCSPAYFPAPAGKLYAVCGADESDEFLRQNQLIQTAWGEHTVPVREAMLGCNHFSVLEALCESGQRCHGLAMELLG
jgi:arylformamidase